MEQLKQMKEQLVGIVQAQLSDIKSVDTKELGDAIDMIKDLADAMKLCEEEKYYKTVTEAMEKAEKEEKHVERHYYTPYPFLMPQEEYPDMDWHYWPERDMDLDMGRMYYGGQRTGRTRDSRGRFTGNTGPRNYYGGPGGNSGRGGNSSGENSSGNSGSSGGNSGGRNYYGGDEPWEHEYPIEMRDSREGRSGKSRRMYMESKELHKDKATKIKDLENYMKELSDDLVEMIEDASPEEKQILEKKISSLAQKIGTMSNV